jgi:formiminoglutamate deiminase
MAAFWCEQAWLGGDGVADGVVLTVTGDVVSGVEPDIAVAPEGATALHGLTLPGFANAHSHAFHRALRGRTHGSVGTFWTWRDQMYELASVLDPEAYQALATATYAEMVLAGYTCVGEFHYLHHGPHGVPYADRNELGRRLVAAADAAGIRLTLLDTCYLAGGIGAELSPVQERFSDGSAEGWIDRAGELGGTAASRVGAAIHSVRAVAPPAMSVVAAWATEHEAVLHAHVSEQPQENIDCRAAYGVSPVGLLDDVGALSERFTAVHATHIDDADVDILGRRRARCCICPTTERELADGIGPTAALVERGIGLCIGSDSHAVIDPFEEARAIELNQRVVSLRRGTHRPADLLTAATASGYESLGWPSGGMLTPGAPADFVTVGFDGPRLAGSDRRDDPLAAVVFAAAPADVRCVVVSGDVVVRDREHQRVDVTAELQRSIAAAWALVNW